VDNAERLALDENFQAALWNLAPLCISTRNTIVEERLRQFQARGNEKEELQREEPPTGLPVLQPQKATRSFNLRAMSAALTSKSRPPMASRPASTPIYRAQRQLALENADFDTAMKVLLLESGTPGAR